MSFFLASGEQIQQIYKYFVFILGITLSTFVILEQYGGKKELHLKAKIVKEKRHKESLFILF